MADFIPAYEEPEEHELIPATTQRTKPKYPTEGPGDGRSWHDYFRALKIEDAAETPEPERIEVLEAGNVLQDATRAPGAPGTLAKRLAAGGWDVKASMSRVRVPAVLYVSDSDEEAEKSYSKGDVRFPAHELETYCILGTKRANNGVVGLAVQATWTRKVGGSFTFEGSTTYDPITGQAWRPSKLKARKQYGWEKEEGVPGMPGLDEWLAIVCPKPKLALEPLILKKLQEEGVWNG